MLISTCSKYIFLSSAGKMGFGDNQAIESAQTISTRNIPVCNCGGTNSKVEGEKETAIRPLFDERVDPLNWVKAAWKLARSHVEEVKEMVEEYERSVVVLDGSSLSIGQVAAVARGGGIVSVKLDSEKAKEYVDRSVEWICQHLLKGTDIYGVTTGFGANSHRRTTEGEKLQQELIRFLNAGILGDENQQDLNLILPVATTRAAMLVRTNTLMQGYSGIRWTILEALQKLLNSQLTPVVPLRGTITASGDLVPLSYIAGVLTARPNARVLRMCRSQENLNAKEALALIDIHTPFQLQPKEGLALVNGTCVGSGVAAIACYDANVLCFFAEVASALFCEVMHGKREFTDALTHRLKLHPGQMEAAAIMEHVLNGSTIMKAAEEFHHGNSLMKPKQDRYALRTAPQWLGLQVEVIRQATHSIEREINSVNDNPIIDVTRDLALHGGNFQGTSIGVSMDSIRLAVYAIGKLIFAQFGELMSEQSNNGLPSNLAGGTNPSLDYGFKGADIAMASYVSELGFLANAVTNHVQSAEQHNQDINSLGLISARKTEEAIGILKLMCSKWLVALSQAVDLRHLEEHYQVVIRKAITGAARSAKLREGMEEKLVQVAEGIPVFSYIDDPTNEHHPLMQKVRQVFAEELVMHAQKARKGTEVEEKLDTIVSKMVAFEGELEAVLIVEVPLAKTKFDEGHFYVPNRIKSCASRPLYDFVRSEQGTKFLMGTQATSPGEEFNKVFAGINAGKLEAPLLKCIQGWNGAPSGRSYN